MFETGFLGTAAPFYMDLVTLYFALLPLLLAVGIAFARQKQYERHFKWQFGLYVVTLIMVVVFEAGVRFSNGYVEFLETSHVNRSMMTAFLIFHVMVAIASVVMWSALIYGAIKSYRVEKRMVGSSHKKAGYYVFAGLTATSIMGIMIYYFLFIMGH